MYHESMKHLLTPIWDLMKDVRKKALMRLEYEGCPSNFDDPATYAMEKYAYYVCFKCKKASEIVISKTALLCPPSHISFIYRRITEEKPVAKLK